MRISIIILALGALGSVSVRAQVVSDTTVVLNGIEVVDSLDRGSLKIRSELIGRNLLQLYPGESLASILDAESFLYVRRNGPSGLATVSLRGLGTLHTRLYLDGLTLNDPQTGQIDVSTLPLTILESVRIDHGGAAVENGRAALGGSVVLNTVRPEDFRSVRTTVSRSAFGYRQAGGLLSGPLGSIKGLVAADFSAETGDFPFADPGSFPVRMTRRQNADRSAGHLFSRIEGAGGQGAWSLSGLWSRIDRNLPGPANAPPSGARQKDRSIRIWGSKRIAFRGGSILVAASGSRNIIRFIHPIEDYSAVSRTRSLVLNAELNKALSSDWLFALNSGFDLDGTDLRRGQSRRELKTGAELTRIVQRLAFSLGVRTLTVSELSTTRSSVDPTLSARLILDREEHLVLLMSAASTFRTPTFNEKFWIPGGNPDLKPETGQSMEFSLQWKTGSRSVAFEVQGTLYRAVMKDRIIWQPSLAAPLLQVWRPVNISRVVGRGVELSLNARKLLTNSMSLGLRTLYTYSRVEDRTGRLNTSFGRQLRYTPEHVAKTTFDIRRGTLEISVSSRITGARYLTSDESRALPAYHELSLRVAETASLAGGQLRLSLSVENAASSEYESIRFYPMPPRYVRFSAVYELAQTKSR